MVLLPSLFKVFALIGTVPVHAQQIYDEFIRGLPVGPDEGLLPKDAICQEPFDIINTRIINGRQTQGNWPFIVRLELYPTRARTEFYQCGASVVNWNWILTAAHCLDDIESADVVVGSWSQDEIVFNETKISTSAFFSHPLYSTEDRRHNDIALIYIEEGIPDNGYVKPICLNDRRPQRRERCFVAGWGSTDPRSKSYSPVLMEAMVPMMDVRACGRPDSYGQIFDDKTMLCAGYWVGKTDTCVGDSGGPLVCIDSDLQPHVAGIISWGKGCAKAQYPGIYTRVGYYVDWIRSIIKTGGENTPGISKPIILPNESEDETGSEPEVNSSTQKTGPIGLGGRMDKDRLNSFMNGIAESGKSLESAGGRREEILNPIKPDSDKPRTQATSVTPGPDNIGPGGESGNGRFYIGGSDKNGERGINSMTPCGDLFEKFNVNLNVEVTCDSPGSRRCKFTCEDPDYQPTLRNAFCKNSRRNRWSPPKRSEVECVRKKSTTLCGSVHRFFNVDLLAAPNCMGNKCRFECPQGSVPSHPQGIRCRAPRLEQWDIEHGTEIRCLKVNDNFNDFTNKCGLLRLHEKTSWITQVRHLNVQCGRQKQKRQVCQFSCDKGKRLVGTDHVTCYRDEQGIFLSDVDRRPVCK